VACSIGVAMMGLIVMAVSDDPKLRYGFVHVALAGAFTAGPLIVAWLVSNTPEKGVRALIVGMNGYSNIAGVIAGQLFKPVYAPSCTCLPYSFPLPSSPSSIRLISLYLQHHPLSFPFLFTHQYTIYPLISCTY